MLKAPPLIPRTYISRASIIDPTEGRYMFENMFEKALKQLFLDKPWAYTG